MKIETFSTVQLQDGSPQLEFVYLDYEGPDNWTIRLYANESVETWPGSPSFSMFHAYNNVLFGNSLFNSGQMQFHNISKNKQMVDMLDVNEVDGLYYGLFKSNVQGDDGGYTVFKSSGDGQGVVKRLPWKVIVPHMFKTCDSLYSLYVVVKGDDGKVQLREISCPDQDIYADRVIEVQRILEEKDGQSIDDGFWGTG